MLNEATTIILKGNFLEECSNRFLCKVSLAEQNPVLCYVSSSARLTNLINLLGHTVCLGSLPNGNRTKLMLLARDDGIRYTLLNLNIVNALIMETLQKEKRYCGKEIRLNKLTPCGYRSDLVVGFKKPEYFEVKSLLSDERRVEFPSITGDRATRQLEQIYKSLLKGERFTYILALLNSKIKEITLGDTNTIYKALFKKCLDNGMRVRVYRLDWRVGGTPNFARTRKIENRFTEGLKGCRNE